MNIWVLATFWLLWIMLHMCFHFFWIDIELGLLSCKVESCLESPLFFYFWRFYLRESKHERGEGRERRSQEQTPWGVVGQWAGEPNAELHSGTPGSWPQRKADTSPTEPPRLPRVLFRLFWVPVHCAGGSVSDSFACGFSLCLQPWTVLMLRAGREWINIVYCLLMDTSPSSWHDNYFRWHFGLVIDKVDI